MSTGLSRKLTRACSVSSEAKICSKLTVQSPSTSAGSEAARSGLFPSSGSAPDGRRPLFLASPICRTRLVTIAMAWKSSVLQN
uniref:Uncharacterized protein n=1 Tax=Astyanax mexicanus TaxID=7994 RepID=A0A8B9H4Y6_ASTMX